MGNVMRARSKAVRMRKVERLTKTNLDQVVAAPATLRARVQQKTQMGIRKDLRGMIKRVKEEAKIETRNDRSLAKWREDPKDEEQEARIPGGPGGEKGKRRIRTGDVEIVVRDQHQKEEEDPTTITDSSLQQAGGEGDDRSQTDKTDDHSQIDPIEEGVE